MLILTIDQTLYANTFLHFTTQRSDIAKVELFSHLAPGNYSLRGVEIFGKSGQEAVDVVAGIGDNMINRLVGGGGISSRED